MLRHRFPSYRRQFTAMADTSDLLGEFPHAGDIRPIRVGRDDPARADVDFPALQEEIRDERERIEAEHLRLGTARAEAESSREKRSRTSYPDAR